MAQTTTTSTPPGISAVRFASSHRGMLRAPWMARSANSDGSRTSRMNGSSVLPEPLGELACTDLSIHRGLLARLDPKRGFIPSPPSNRYPPGYIPASGVGAVLAVSVQVERYVQRAEADRCGGEHHDREHDGDDTEDAPEAGQERGDDEYGRHEQGTDEAVGCSMFCFMMTSEVGLVTRSCDRDTQTEIGPKVIPPWVYTDRCRTDPSDTRRPSGS